MERFVLTGINTKGVSLEHRCPYGEADRLVAHRQFIFKQAVRSVGQETRAAGTLRKGDADVLNMAAIAARQVELADELSRLEPLWAVVRPETRWAEIWEVWLEALGPAQRKQVGAAPEEVRVGLMNKVIALVANGGGGVSDVSDFLIFDLLADFCSDFLIPDFLISDFWQ